jgi:hypothetical protein
MPVQSNIGGAEPSTVTFRVATVTISRGSTAEQQEILVLGDPNTSNALAAVLNATPASTAWGLAVRPLFSSTGADNPVSVSNWSSIVSVANTVTIAGNSTVVVASGNSSVIITAGNSSVTVSALPPGMISTAAPATGDTGLFVRQVGYVAPSTTVSVANTVTIQGNTTSVQGTSPWTIAGNSTVVISGGQSSVTATITAGNSSVIVTAGNSSVIITAGNSSVLVTNWSQSSVAPSSGSSGLIVRPVIDVILSAGSANAFASSTIFAVNTSVASVRAYVTAYSILTTNAGPTAVGFFTSATLIWPMVFAAPSSCVTGANLAVSAPAYLFRGGAGEAVSVIASGSTIAGWAVGVSYFLAP